MPITMQITHLPVWQVFAWKKNDVATHISPFTPRVDFQFVWENDAAHVQPLDRQIAYFGAAWTRLRIVIAACFCTLSSTKVALKQINSVRPAYTVYRARLSTRSLAPAVNSAAT